MTNETVESQQKEQNEDKKSNPSKDKNSVTDSSGGRTSRIGHKGELERLRKSLEKEASKIRSHKVVNRQFTPNVYSSLEPYCDTTTAAKVITQPPTQPKGYQNRQTAIGLCDPWKDYAMDQPPMTVQTEDESVNKEEEPKKEPKKSEKQAQRTRKKEGSTHLPKYPAVTVSMGPLTNKPLTYNDVPALREELKKKYSQNATAKIDQEYTRTKQDFYRMDLDQLDKYHEINRPHMRAAYFAYLQNNPGSKKAVHECTREAEKQLQEQEEQKEWEEMPQNVEQNDQRNDEQQQEA